MCVCVWFFPPSSLVSVAVLACSLSHLVRPLIQLHCLNQINSARQVTQRAKLDTRIVYVLLITLINAFETYPLLQIELTLLDELKMKKNFMNCERLTKRAHDESISTKDDNDDENDSDEELGRSDFSFHWTRKGVFRLMTICTLHLRRFQNTQQHHHFHLHISPTKQVSYIIIYFRNYRAFMHGLT